MFAELIAGHLLLIFFAVVGLPFALLVDRLGSDPLRHRLAPLLAPSFGIAVIGLISYPLYAFVGAVQAWAPAATAALLVSSSIASYVLWRCGRDQLDPLVYSGAATLLVSGVLCIPPLSGGLERVAYIYNPSDTLTYLTLADSVRAANLGAVWAGRVPTTSLESAALLSFSDTGLYSSRFLEMPIRLATMIDLAWFSAVSQIGVERLLYCFSLAALLAAVPSTLALLQACGVPPWAAAGGAVVVALGPWTTAIRDHDAYSQVQVLPVLVAALGARALLSGRLSAVQTALPALLLAGAVCIYTEYTIVLVAWLAGEAGIFLMRDRHFSSRAILPAVLMLATVLVLFLAGDLPLHSRIVLNQFKFATAASGPVGSTLFDDSWPVQPFALLGGMSWLADVVNLNRTSAWELMYGETIAAGLVAVTMGCAIFAAFFGPTKVAQIAILWLVTAAACAYVAFSKLDYYIIFKILATGYAAAIIVLLISAFSAGGLARKFLAMPARFCSLLIVGAQLGYAGHYAVGSLSGNAPHQAITRNTRSYDITRLIDRVAELRPQNLLLYAPPSDRWWEAALLIFPLKPFKPFHQAGYLFDNNQKRLEHGLMRRQESFDYAIVSVEADYMRELGNVELVMEDNGLRLYRVLTDAPELHLYRSEKKGP